MLLSGLDESAGSVLVLQESDQFFLCWMMLDVPSCDAIAEWFSLPSANLHLVVDLELLVVVNQVGPRDQQVRMAVELDSHHHPLDPIPLVVQQVSWYILVP